MERVDRDALAAAQARLIERRVALGIATRGEHARTAVRKRGRRVRCIDCDARSRQRTHRGRRLRELGCPECGGRLRPENWAGFDPVTS